MTNILKRIYIRTTGYSYTHMGRLFLRLFVGLMMMQFGVRQWINYDQYAAVFPALPCLTSEASMTLMIIIEIFCSFCIMAGFCTRLMTLPPFVAMIIAECYLLQLTPEASYMLNWTHSVYLPIMFLGIYFFIFLVGPGKISVDYFLSLYFIHSDNQSESELEEV